jgi:hypothetical protein
MKTIKTIGLDIEDLLLTPKTSACQRLHAYVSPLLAIRYERSKPRF